MSVREQIFAVFKPGDVLSKAEIANASGVVVEKLGYYLNQLAEEGKIVAIGVSTARRFSLPDASSATPARARSRGSSHKQRHNKRRATPAPAAARVGNVTDFTAAMTFDRRMVLLGASEPLVFSPEQTQQIADLMLANFELPA